MAPFRRGKSGVRASTGRTFVTGRSSQKVSPHRVHTSSAAPNNDFQTSRIDEIVKSDLERSESTPPASVSDSGSEELLSHESSSESTVSLEEPYSVLLQALKPSISLGEPKRKRRKVEPSEASISVQNDYPEGADASEELEEVDFISEDDTDSSGVDDVAPSKSYPSMAGKCTY